jgi:hypothetical protein
MKTNRILIYAFLCVLISSCSSMYIPSMPSTPLLEEKGQKQISVGLSTNSIQLSGDYAFSDNYAAHMSGNLSYHNFSKNYDIFTDENTENEAGMFTPDWDYGEFSHRYGEIGVGRYNLLKSKWRLELFTGAGYGNAFEREGEITNNYYLGYIQGNLGRKIRNHNVKFGFSWRIADSYFDFSYVDYSKNNSKRNIRFDNISYEPAVFFEAGNEYARFYVKGGLSLMDSFTSFNNIDLSHGIKNGKLNYTVVHISVGINFN